MAMRHSFKKMAGYTFIELSVVIAIGTLLSALATKAFIDDYQEDLAESTGGYQNSLKSILEDYTTTYVTELTNNTVLNTPGGGTISAAESLRPTFAQLKQSGAMPAGFPEFNPFKQRMEVRITRSAACPGPGCQITGYAYTTTPLTISNGRDDLLANQARAKSNGYGIISPINAPGTLVGRNCEPIANPIAGTPPNILGVCSVLNAGLYAQFVRRGDGRLTELNNGLNVNGDINGRNITASQALSGQTVNATGAITGQTLTTSGDITSTNGNITAANGAIRATGNGANSRVGVGTGPGCSLAELSVSGGAGRIVANAANCVVRAFLDASSGIMAVANAGGTPVVQLNGNTSTLTAGTSANNTVTVDGVNGSVTAPGQVSVTQSGGAVRATLTNNGQITARDTGANPTVVLDGGASTVSVGGTRVVLNGASGLATAEALQPSSGAGAKAIGDACPAAEQGQIRRNATGNGSLVLCQSGSYVAIGPRVVAPNASCPLAGEIGVTTTGDTMFCKPAGGGPAGFFVPMRNLMSDFVFIASTYVRDGNVLPKPTCAQFGGSTGVALVFVVGQTEGSPDASFNRYATDNGSSWTIRLKRGDNSTALIGDLALAQQYCYYAS